MKLEHIAKKAGVSLTTVSRVLNEGQYVMSTTRAKVLRALKEFKYYPNLHARSLAAGRSRTIGVILSNLDNPFFLDVFRTIKSLAHAIDYEVIVAATHYDTKQLHASIKLMLGLRVAGIAVIVSEMEPSVAEELANAGIHVAFYDIGMADKKSTSIKVNYKKSMEHLVEYFYSLGHRRMAYNPTFPF
jgi:DNA-binding LacI/PurR family transcriptional regulator